MIKHLRLFKKLTINFISKFKQRIELKKYDDFTIAEHFRKQGAQIGEDCFIAIRTLAGEPYLVKIGNHVGIASNVQLLTHNLGWCFRDERPDLQLFGTITILDNCNIGVGSIILPNVTIGPNSIVAAGSVVIKDVPPDSIVGGNPAKSIATTEKYKEKVFKQWDLQKPLGYFEDLKKGVRYSSKQLHEIKLKNRDMLKRHLTTFFWDEKSGSNKL